MSYFMAIFVSGLSGVLLDLADSIGHVEMSHIPQTELEMVTLESPLPTLSY